MPSNTDSDYAKGTKSEPDVTGAKSLSKTLQDLTTAAYEMADQDVKRESLADFLERMGIKHEDLTQHGHGLEMGAGGHVERTAKKSEHANTGAKQLPNVVKVRSEATTEPIERILTRAREDGYQRGWDAGKALGHLVGFEQGKKAGRAEGLRDGWRRGVEGGRGAWMGKGVGNTNDNGYVVD